MRLTYDELRSVYEELDAAFIDSHQIFGQYRNEFSDAEGTPGQQRSFVAITDDITGARARVQVAIGTRIDEIQRNINEPDDVPLEKEGPFEVIQIEPVERGTTTLRLQVTT